MSIEIDNIENLMNNKNVEFRDFKLSGVETRKAENGAEELIVEGVACVFDKETVLIKGKSYELREKVQQGAFDGADMSDVIFNYNHGGRVYARTRNSSLALEAQSDGLHMRAKLISGDEGHAQLYRDIQSGLIDKMSYAYTVRESTYEYTEQENGFVTELRTVTKIDRLFDVSAVDIPAYDATSISARRAFDAEREKRSAESTRRAKNKLNLKLKLEGV